MRSLPEQTKERDAHAQSELTLLQEVVQTPALKQRPLAGRLELSLGLTNFLVRSIVRKGYVTIVERGWRNRLYVLTPAGLVRKARLTASFIGRFMDDFGQVNSMLEAEILKLSLHRESRIGIYGTGQFAQLLYLALAERDISEVGLILRPDSNKPGFLGLTAVPLEAIDPTDYDRILLANLGDTDDGERELTAAGVPLEMVVTLFGINAPPPSPSPGDGTTARGERA